MRSSGSLVKALRLKGRANETLDTDSINQLNQDIRSFINNLPDNTELSFMVDVNSDCKEVIDSHLGFAKQGTEIVRVAESRGAGILQTLLSDLQKSLIVQGPLYSPIFS
jgi:hypothetical protein